jgi:ribosomal subunit interface protein
MKTTIKRTGDFTEDIGNYVEEKFSSLGKFVKHFEEAGEIELSVELLSASKHHKHGDIFTAVAELRLPKKNLRAEEVGEDIRTAIDRARDTLRSEIEKYKTQFVELDKKKLGK